MKYLTAVLQDHGQYMEKYTKTGYALSQIINSLGKKDYLFIWISFHTSECLKTFS